MPRRQAHMPSWAIYAMVLAVPLALLPFALIARSRAVRHGEARLRFFQDMAIQAKLQPQAQFNRYADHRAARPPIPGTVARGQLHADEHFYTGGHRVAGQWQPLSGYPAGFAVTEATLRRGQQRFNIYCSTCHGMTGTGNGLIHRRAERLQTTGWVQPSNLQTLDPTDGKLIYGEEKYPNGKLFAVITHGVRTMPAYGAQIRPADRWAIVAYIRALQLSQNATPDDVPQARQATLR